jgi:branched-chain amino acid transport system ATP-binding protein
MPLLRIQDITRRFGGLSVLSGVALSIAPGEVRSVIGPNGAGKTTLFNIITGVIPPTSGRIFFRDRDITGLSPAATFRLGLVRSFQVSQLFPRLTARESVRLMVEGRFRTSGSPGSRVQIGVADIDRRTDAALERLGIAHRAGDLCGWLAHGERRLVEMAMVIAAEPALLLLDEPTAGMTPDDSLRTADLLRSLAPEITLLIVEHDMRVVMRVSDRVSVLHQGRILADGTADEILHDPQVEAVYLGRQARDGRRTA